MSDGDAETAEELYEEAPCGYLTTRPDGTIVRVNGTFLRWTGHAREALVGRRFQDLLTGGGRIYHETHYAPLLRMQGRVREIALDIVRADGSRLPALVNATLKVDAAGEPQLVRAMVFDATDRQRYERELLAARDRERLARERADALQRATAAIASAPDRETIALTLIEQLTAAFGSGHAGVAVQDPETGDVAVFAAAGAPLPGQLAPLTGPVYDEGDPGARGALARVPLPQGGTVWIGFEESRPIDAGERALLEGCALQAGLALERRRLYEQSRDVAHVLQRSLLATAPPEDPRVEIASVYQPAVEHLEVGGDWHDAFALPDGRLGIAIGDVVGRGVGAASAMGQLRSAVRALAGAGQTPGQVLGHLDVFVEQVVAARYATVLYAEVDPATGEACSASAGHLPLSSCATTMRRRRSCSWPAAPRRSASAPAARGRRGASRSGPARASSSIPTGSSSGAASRSTTASRGCSRRSAPAWARPRRRWRARCRRRSWTRGRPATTSACSRSAGAKPLVTTPTGARPSTAP